VRRSVLGKETVLQTGPCPEKIMGRGKRLVAALGGWERNVEGRRKRGLLEKALAGSRGGCARAHFSMKTFCSGYQAE